MSKENELANPTVPGNVVSVTPAAGLDYDTAFDGIGAAMQEALQGMLLGNDKVAWAAAQKADAYFLLIRPNRERNYLYLSSLRALTKIYSLTSLIAKQVAELAISEAYDSFEQSADYARQGRNSLDVLFEIDPDAKGDLEITQFREIFSILEIANEAGRLFLEAQEALYQSNPLRYLDKLAEASASFRRVNTLLPSFDPIIIALKEQQIAQAERLDKQSKNYRLDLFVDPVDQFIPVRGQKILIIHGHAEDRWRELRDLLESWNVETSVLWEEISASQTIIEKFQRFANQCSFAFALMTPEDIVQKDDGKYGQARPNVLFETGWFFGRFGPSRVGIIAKEDTILPSDLSGVVTFRFNKKVSEQSESIRKSLKALGVLNDG